MSFVFEEEPYEKYVGTYPHEERNKIRKIIQSIMDTHQEGMNDRDVAKILNLPTEVVKEVLNAHSSEIDWLKVIE